jgi:ACR3 family arsenite transporter
MKKLSFFDRYLTVWIFLAIIIGIITGKVYPQAGAFLDQFRVGAVNLPIAIGLILMMYPPLAKVRYETLPTVFRDVKLLVLAFVLIWVVAPLLMFGLASLFLQGYPEYFTGLVLIGIAPCIAMVLVWNDLAEGNREYAAGLVAANSLIQLLIYPVMALFYIYLLPKSLGLTSVLIEIEWRMIAESVLIYLGIPFLLGLLSRQGLARLIGNEAYENRFLPRISVFTPAALLFTIVVMFALKAETFFELPLDMIRIAVPLLCYFLVMFFGSWFLANRWSYPYPERTALAFTAAGNNFELAMAVAIGVWGLNSGQAFAAVIGPLIEVPVLVLLVQFALKQRR